MIFKRKKYLKAIYDWLKKEKLIIIYWARQVWKTTLLKILLNDENLNFKKIYINFDDIYEKTFKTKNEFITFLEFNYWVNFYEEWILFLDEVQTIENIEQILKSIYDDVNIKLKIIATWSWLWQIEKLWSSLVWRTKQIYVYPFSFMEFLEFKSVNIDFLTLSNYKDFMFDNIKNLLIEYYTFWWYPAVVKLKTKLEKIEKISEIIDIYLKKDVQLFLSGKEIVNFKKIFAFLANNIASGLNISELSNFLWVSRNKTERYLEILERSFLLHKVYPFFSNLRKEYSKQAEVFLNDLWIINYFRNNFNFLDFNWQLVENFVYLELLKNRQIFSDEIKTYNKINWSEIDFIYEFKVWGILPIEVRINNKDVIPKIFSSFAKDYQEKILFFVKTSKSLLKYRRLDKFDVKIVPFWMISQVLEEWLCKNTLN